MIDVKDLVVGYPGVVALDGVSLTVAAGDVVALLGPNGAGKTTLLETIEGYRRPASGTVTVFGLDPHTNRAQLAARWGTMPQSNGLPMGLTVGEAVNLFARLYGSDRNPGDLLEATGLSPLAGRRWRRLSGGEQQRLSLAIALAGGPDLLLLDEPTTAVDQVGRDRVLSVIRERARAGAGVLVTTHRFDDAEAVADRVVVLDRGRVVGQGHLDELTRVDDAIAITIDNGRGSAVPPAESAAFLARSLGVAVDDLGHGRLRVELEPSPANLARLTSVLAERDITASGVEAGRRSLADTYRHLTGGSDADRPNEKPTRSTDRAATAGEPNRTGP